MRIAAIIQNNEITNVVVIADGSEGDSTLNEYAADGILAVEITDLDPMPGMGTGWLYVDGAWTFPAAHQQTQESSQTE